MCMQFRIESTFCHTIKNVTVQVLENLNTITHQVEIILKAHRNKILTDPTIT